MTRAKILAMEPGRELDALVAVKVMGYRSVSVEYGSVSKERGFPEAWEPSTFIEDVWEVVEELNGKFSFTLQRLGDYFYQDDDYGWEALFSSNEDRKVTAKTAPEAICKAALLAVMDL